MDQAQDPSGTVLFVSPQRLQFTQTSDPRCISPVCPRKKKLLKKQKKGKAKMKQFGGVNIPQKAFVSVLRADDD